MHYSTKHRLMLGMTTGGLLMTGLGMATAHADTTATGETANSPGVGSGNLIQIPISAPINVCGNQVDVIGILDSVTGNSCSNGAGVTPTPTQPTPTPTGCGCPPPPPPPPTTQCPPSGTTTSTPTSSAPGGSPSSTANPTSTGSHGGSTGGPTGGSTGGPTGGSTGSSTENGSPGKPTGTLAHTGSGALAVAPLGAGLIGGGVLLRKRFPTRSH